MATPELIEKAVSIAGSQHRLAEVSGLSQQFISKLQRGERGVTAETALAIERATNGRVSRHDLRPDLWPASKQSEAAE